MRTSAILLAVLAASCAGTNGPAPAPAHGGPERTPNHETYLRNPTEILADSARVILPTSYRDGLRVRGLSAGWRASGVGEVWEGAADCRLDLLELSIVSRELTVTLVPGGGEPEVIILALGSVRLVHTVAGTSTVAEDMSLLQIRNQRRLER